MDILCINCVDQVILYTIFFVTGDFIVAFVFCIWRYFNGTDRRGSFEARSAAVGQPSGGAARRIASEALVGRRAGRRAGEHPGADGRFSRRWKGRPRGGAGPSGNRGVGAPDGGRNAGSGRRVRSGAGLLAGSAPRTGVADPGSRGPGFRETKPFGAASFGVGAATGWRADRRSEAWLLSGHRASGKANGAATGEATASRGADSFRGVSARRWAPVLRAEGTRHHPSGGSLAGPAQDGLGRCAV